MATTIRSPRTRARNRSTIPPLSLPRERIAAAKKSRIPVSQVAITSVDGWLLATIVLLSAFGMVMVYSASEVLGYSDYGNANYFFERQLVGLVIGAVGFIIAARKDYHAWLVRTKLLAIIAVIALVVVLVPGVGSERLGARRWFTLGSISIQPSVIATLVGILFFSKWLVARGSAIRTDRVVWRYLVVMFGLLFLIILEKDLGSCLVMAAIGLVLLALSGVRKRHLIAVTSALAGVGYLAIKLESYRAVRLANFGNPFADPLNTGFQSVQSLYAFGSGGVTGVGLGHSIQKFQWLPEAHTDFIFAIIGEELGLIGTVLVVLTFLLLAWRGVMTAMRAPDKYGTLLAGGITAWVCVQAFINIAAVTNLVPTTGIPLPFISYGTSSLIMTLIACGILCNISAQGRRQGELQRAHFDSGRRNWGTSSASSGRRPGTAR